MKRLTLFLMCVMASLALTAQNTRLVKGLVFSEDDIPMKGVTLKAVGMDGSTVSAESGQFELYVSPYAKKIEASMEGYVSHTLEIDGSYLVFKMKVDKEYAKRKAAEEEAARVAAEQAKAAEEARIAAEKEAARVAAAEKAAEEERIRKAAEKEAAAKAKAEERARKATEREAIAQAKAAEREAQAKTAEQTPSATSSKMVEVNSKEKTQEIVAPTNPFEKLGVKKSKKNVERLSWADNVRRAHNERSGYRSFVEYSELDVDACAYLQGASYVGGYYVAKQRIFFGIGLSHLEGGGITSGAHMNSLYLHGKWYVTKSLIRPYVAVSTGLESYVSDHPSTGVYFNPQAGLSVPIFRTLETYASIGYYCTSRKCSSIHPAYHTGWTFNVGISF